MKYRIRFQTELNNNLWMDIESNNPHNATRRLKTIFPDAFDINVQPLKEE